MYFNIQFGTHRWIGFLLLFILKLKTKNLGVFYCINYWQRYDISDHLKTLYSSSIIVWTKDALFNSRYISILHNDLPTANSGQQVQKRKKKQKKQNIVA